jgi:hypothetical protein
VSIQISCQSTTPNSNFTASTGQTVKADQSDWSGTGLVLARTITPSSGLRTGRSTYAFRLSRQDLSNGEVQMAF